MWWCGMSKGLRLPLTWVRLPFALFALTWASWHFVSDRKEERRLNIFPTVCMLDKFLASFSLLTCKNLHKKCTSIDKLEIEMTCIGNLSFINFSSSIWKTYPIIVGKLSTLTYILKFSLVRVIFFVIGKALHLRWWSERWRRLSTRPTRSLFFVCCRCWMNNLPQQISKSDALAS